MIEQSGVSVRALVLPTLLWVAVLASALSVVRVAHESRQKLNQLEVLRREASELHVQWGQYLLEQSAWSAYGRIEQQAVDELGMVQPEGDQLVVLQ